MQRHSLRNMISDDRRAGAFRSVPVVFYEMKIIVLAATVFAVAARAALPPTGTVTDWDECYRADALPEAGEWAWGLSAGANTTARVEPDGLRIIDRGTAKGELRFYTRQWHADQTLGGWAEARLKVISCSGQSGVILMVADGTNEVSLTFYADRIEFGPGQRSHKMDTAGAFHSYRLELQGPRGRLSVDARLVVDESSGLSKPAHGGRNHVGFGSCSSPATGEAEWEFVRYHTFTPALPAGQLVEGGEPIHKIIA